MQSSKTKVLGSGLAKPDNSGAASANQPHSSRLAVWASYLITAAALSLPFSALANPTARSGGSTTISVTMDGSTHEKGGRYLTEKDMSLAISALGLIYATNVSARLEATEKRQELERLWVVGGTGARGPIYPDDRGCPTTDNCQLVQHFVVVDSFIRSTLGLTNGVISTNDYQYTMTALEIIATNQLAGETTTAGQKSEQLRTLWGEAKKKDRNLAHGQSELLICYAEARVIVENELTQYILTRAANSFVGQLYTIAKYGPDEAKPKAQTLYDLIHPLYDVGFVFGGGDVLIANYPAATALINTYYPIVEATLIKNSWVW